MLEEEKTELIHNLNADENITFMPSFLFPAAL
jgi:hypothetical protein